MRRTHEGYAWALANAARTAAKPASDLLVSRTGELWTVSGVASLIFGSVKVSVDSYVDEANPNTNYGTNQYLWVKGGTGIIRRVFIKKPAQAGGNYLHIRSTIRHGYEIEAYEVSASWSEGSITWNNQPALGSFISDEDARVYWRTYGPVTSPSVALVFHDETEGAVAHYSAENGTASYIAYFDVT